MSFQEKLQQLVERVEGGIACVLMGSDGLTIDSYHLADDQTPFDPATFGIECTGLLQQISTITQRTRFGDPLEFVIRSEHHTAIFRFLTEEYFILLLLTPDGNAGKGRYLLRTASSSLREELFT